MSNVQWKFTQKKIIALRKKCNFIYIYIYITCICIYIYMYTYLLMQKEALKKN